MRATTLLALLASAAFAALAACSSDSEASYEAGNGQDAGAGSRGDGEVVAPSAGADGPVASGIVVVHGATFPSFRLCFENAPGSRPAPEQSLKPQANVVGVEVGSVVRIDPIAAPGKVHVIDVAALQGGGRDAASCADLICAPGSTATCLSAASYATLDAIDEPIGQGNVELLALTGCGRDFVLTDLGASAADCGPTYEPSKGNLTITRLPLFPQVNSAGTGTLPVQLVHLSPVLNAQAAGRPLEVTFGDLGTAGPLGEVVASDLPLFEQSDPVRVSYDAADEAVYGTHGFRIALRGDGGAPFQLDQSLAAVQDLSAPNALPASYYAVASNYVLLLLGNPKITRTTPDGGANPAFDERRALHLLAVPVIDPASIDAGADGGPSGDEDGGS